MSKKWYNLFVSVKETPEADAQESAPSAAQTVADIAASLGPATTGRAPTANAVRPGQMRSPSPFMERVPAA